MPYLIREDLEKIVNHYGLRNQVAKTIEEMSELTHELCRWLIKADPREEESATAEMVEELADTYIMLGQMLVGFNIHDDVVKIMDEKLDRQKKRIKAENITTTTVESIEILKDKLVKADEMIAMAKDEDLKSIYQREKSAICKAIDALAFVYILEDDGK